MAQRLCCFDSVSWYWLLSFCHIPHEWGFLFHPGPITVSYLSSALSSSSSRILPHGSLRACRPGLNAALQVSLTLDVCFPGSLIVFYPKLSCHLILFCLQPPNGPSCCWAPALTLSYTCLTHILSDLATDLPITPLFVPPESPTGAS